MSLGASFNTSFTDMTQGMKNVSGSTGAGKTRASGRLSRSLRGTGSVQGSEQLQLDPAALTQIISDVLGSEQGLANIFSQEKGAGLFSSTVAAEATGDLTAKLVGEIAKLTGKLVTTEDSAETSKINENTFNKSENATADEGIIGGIGHQLEKFGSLFG